MLPFEPGWHRVMVNDHGHVADHDEPVTFGALRTALIRVAGTDYGMRSPRWLSRFGDAARQADRYRSGRVLLAGDAAHIHFPAGGQGLNLGVQDAVNLGWKLASVVRGHVPEQILDSYHAERHPIAARVLQNTRAQSALGRPGAQTDALREVFGSLIEFDEVNRYLAYMITALDVRYPMGEGHPLLGRRVPDVDIATADGDTRVVNLLHASRPVLLDLSGGVADLADVVQGWTDRVDHVEAKCPAEHWAVPAAGSVPAPCRPADPARRVRRLGRAGGRAGRRRVPAYGTGDLVRSQPDSVGPPAGEPLAGASHGPYRSGRSQRVEPESCR